VIFGSKLKVCERYGDERRDKEQDGEDDAQNAVERVRLVEPPNCNHI
jgi:hypothetical protein